MKNLNIFKNELIQLIILVFSNFLASIIIWSIMLMSNPLPIATTAILITTAILCIFYHCSYNTEN